MIEENLNRIKSELPSGVKLVAVSKFHPLEAIQEAYKAGQRAFGENRPQELCAKVPAMDEWLKKEYPDGIPGEVEWHFLGHLQTNKLKMVLPFVSMVQSVDSIHLLQAIDSWGKNNGKVTDILLELHIGAEETKQGFHEEEVLDILFNADKYKNVRFRGLMGMASHTDDMETVNSDFERIDSFMAYLVDLFPELDLFNQLSIGMSGDWKVAVRNGSTMVRIGTSIFGERQY